MATKSFRDNGEGTSRSISSKDGPQFFKIIFSCELTTMRIPVEFVRRYGKNLPKVASFEVPTGEVFEIQLVHSQGRIWLAKGWEEFTKNYSIRYGHFLVFRYDGKSHFHVLIFDKTASEIEYPQIVSHGAGRCNDRNMESDDDVEILNHCSTGCGPNKRKRQQEDQTHASIGSKHGFQTQMTDNQMSKNGISFCNRFNHDMPCSDHQPKKICANRVKVENSQDDGGSPSLMTPKINGEKQSLVKKEMSAAYQRAKAFKSNNPFHIAVMHPSYVCSSNKMRIPLAFAKKHFPGKYNDLVLVSSGRSWSARCTLNTQHGRIYGWKAFVQDNKLKVGDVCILEIVKSKKLTVNVIIFPADD